MECSQAQTKENCSNFGQMSKSELNGLILDNCALKAQTQRVPFSDRFLGNFKAQMFKIRTCRNLNHHLFRFWHFPDFGRSDFGIPLEKIVLSKT